MKNKTARRVSCEYESWQQTCNFCSSKYAKVAEQRFEKTEDVVENSRIVMCHQQTLPVWI